MDNLVLKKIWQDDNLIELQIKGEAEFISAWQSCYVQDIKLEEAAAKVIEFMSSDKTNCYIELGSKEGNYTPAFSMLLSRPDIHGRIKIELDIEIADNDSRCHRCQFFVVGEMGAVERFARQMREIVTADVGYVASMFNV